ncbi:PAS domain S-box protein [Bacillus sp. 03113]|uniref:PAS domain S-box protein n=1 Tax=Bacillus sp. 03113 TaxID=2578211 RepID=UPI0015E88136|nr:PAS domain S-box protein [Bacillus sp. 03113]
MQNFTTNLIPKKSSTKKSNNEKSAEKVNILMVDDSDENLLALEAVLMSPNYHLVSARSGEEALMCILKQDFAVILLDVQMPVLNGFETAKLIKSREKSKDIPIIFITAISKDMDHVLRGYSVGAIDYVFKPFNPETIKRKIEQFVKIHQNHQRILKKNERERSLELEEVHHKLNLATLDLQKTEALSKVIGETLMDTIVTLDEEGFILSVNPAAKQMFGYQESELLGKHITSLLYSVMKNGEKVTPFTKSSLKNALTGNIMEAFGLRKDESSFAADIQIGKAAFENFHLFVCSIRDVTERKEIENERIQQVLLLEKIVEDRTLDLLSANEKLQKEIQERQRVADDLYVSEERFRKIFEASPCLMAILSVKDGRCIDVNQSWLHYTEYDYIEIKNQVFDFEICRNSDNEKLSFQNKDQTDSINNMKINYKTKNGTIQHALLSTEMIDIQNEACILLVMNDITEQELLEKEMSRLDRLNLIGEMAAGIAHEIRNPMTTVQGFLQMGRLDNELLSLSHIDLMLEELNRANTIIKEFLNLARNKASDKSPRFLNDIIEALFPLINAEAMLASKGVNLVLTRCPELLLDEKEIRQLVLNLALNGLEAMSAGGILTIKTYFEQDEVVLKIIDTGKGIKQEHLDKIGTPFFTTKENGTGLGLAICYSIADRHHAAIEVQTSHQGTTFSIHFSCPHSFQEPNKKENK